MEQLDNAGGLDREREGESGDGVLLEERAGAIADAETRACVFGEEFECRDGEEALLCDQVVILDRFGRRERVEYDWVCRGLGLGAAELVDAAWFGQRRFEHVFNETVCLAAHVHAAVGHGWWEIEVELVVVLVLVEVRSVVLFGFPFLTAAAAARQYAPLVCLIGDNEVERPAEGAGLVRVLAFVQDLFEVEEPCPATVVACGLAVLLDDAGFRATPE